MSFIKEYREEIRKGNIIAGKWIIKVLDNLIDDMKNPLYKFDTKECYKRFKFQEKACLQKLHPYYMKPIKLMLWQKAFWEAVYSFYMADSGKRRFTEALLEVARKNGKSTMFAADGNTDLFIGVGGINICCASNDDKQAKLIWSEIGGMRGRLDPKKKRTSQNLTEIVNRKKDITIFRLSSKTQNKDGFNIYKTYLDESHDMRNSDIADACWRGMSSQDEPLFLNCTTQGHLIGDDFYLYKRLNYARNVIDKKIDDIHFLAFLYEQDDEQEIWQDESSWEKSNPSIRYGVKKVDKLRRDLEAARFDNETKIKMLVKDFNREVGSSSAWLMQEDYDYPQHVHKLEDFRNCYALAAVDLSETTDLTNVKLLIMKPNDNTKYIFSHYWIPSSKLQSSDDKKEGANYEEWAKQGYVTICDGADNNLVDVADWLFALKDMYGIRIVKCGYDVKFAKEFVNRCEMHGIYTEVIQQTSSVMSSPMSYVEADLKHRVINYGLNPVDKWCLGNASMQVDNLGRTMCVKINNQRSKRIDGAVTLIILYATLQRFKNKYMEYVLRTN